MNIWSCSAASRRFNLQLPRNDLQHIQLYNSHPTHPRYYKAAQPSRMKLSLHLNYHSCFGVTINALCVTHNNFNLRPALKVIQSANYSIADHFRPVIIQLEYCQAGLHSSIVSGIAIVIMMAMIRLIAMTRRTALARRIASNKKGCIQSFIY